MRETLGAIGRALRTFGQGLAAAALFAGGEALNTALAGGSFNPRYVVMAVAAAVAGAVVTYVFNVVAPFGGVSGSPSIEGIVRAVRTIIQTAAGVGLIAAWDAVYVAVTGGNYSPGDIAKAALAAAVTAVLAFFHNTAAARKANTARA